MFRGKAYTRFRCRNSFCREIQTNPIRIIKRITMIESIITDYLKSNRRLILPGLGAFLKKEDESLVFVPFLNKDDGILNNLVRQNYGTSQTEAASIIDQYTATILAAIENQGSYLIIATGSLKKDPNGIIFLDTNALTPASSAKAATPQTSPAAKQPTSVHETQTPVTPAPQVTTVPTTAPTAEQQPVATQPKIPVPAATNKPVSRPAGIPQGEPRQEIRPTVNRPQIPIQEQNQARTMVNRSAQIGQPNGNSEPRQTAPRVQPQQEVLATPTPAVAERPVSVRPVAPAQEQPPKKKGDFILTFAIIIALIAIAVMIYAYCVVDLPVFNLR